MSSMTSLLETAYLPWLKILEGLGFQDYPSIAKSCRRGRDVVNKAMAEATDASCVSLREHLFRRRHPFSMYRLYGTHYKDWTPAQSPYVKQSETRGELRSPYRIFYQACREGFARTVLEIVEKFHRFMFRQRKPKRRRRSSTVAMDVTFSRTVIKGLLYAARWGHWSIVKRVGAIYINSWLSGDVRLALSLIAARRGEFGHMYQPHGIFQNNKIAMKALQHGQWGILLYQSRRSVYGCTLPFKEALFAAIRGGVTGKDAQVLDMFSSSDWDKVSAIEKSTLLAEAAISGHRKTCLWLIEALNLSKEDIEDAMTIRKTPDRDAPNPGRELLRTLLPE